MHFWRISGFDLCGFKLSSLDELNSPQLCFVFHSEVKPPIRACGITIRGFPPLMPVLLWNSVFNSLRYLQAWLKITLFGFNSRWMDTLKGVWKHLVCWTVSPSSLNSSEWEVSERGRVNCKHFTHSILWNIYQSHFPGLDKLMFWQQIKHRR